MIPERENNVLDQINSDRLSQAFKISKFQGMVLDLDDTLVDADYLTKCKRQAEKIILEMLPDQKIKVEAGNNFNLWFSQFVDRWGGGDLVMEELVERIDQKYKIGQKARQDSLKILYERHKGDFPAMKEAKDLLKAVHACDKKIGVLTMSNKEDAKRKCENAGFLEYVDLIRCVPDGGKMVKHWSEVSGELGINPAYCLAGGDHLTYDVTASFAAGYKWVVFFNSKKNKLQSYPTFSLKGIKEVSSMQDLYNFMLNLPAA